MIIFITNIIKINLTCFEKSSKSTYFKSQWDSASDACLMGKKEDKKQSVYGGSVYKDTSAKQHISDVSTRYNTDSSDFKSQCEDVSNASVMGNRDDEEMTVFDGSEYGDASEYGGTSTTGDTSDVSRRSNNFNSHGKNISYLVQRRTPSPQKIDLRQELNTLLTYPNYRQSWFGHLHLYKRKKFGHKILKRQVDNPDYTNTTKFVDSVINVSHNRLISAGCNIENYNLDDISALLHYGEKQPIIYISRKQGNYIFFRFQYNKDHTIDINNPQTKYLEIRENKVLDFSQNKTKIFHREDGKLYALTFQGSEIVPSDEMSFITQYNTMDISCCFLPKKLLDNNWARSFYYMSSVKSSQEQNYLDKYKVLIEYCEDWLISIQDDNSMRTITTDLIRKDGKPDYETVTRCINKEILPLFEVTHVPYFNVEKMSNGYKLLEDLDALGWFRAKNTLLTELSEQIMLKNRKFVFYDNTSMMKTEETFKLIEDDVENDNVIKVTKPLHIIISNKDKYFLSQLVYEAHVYVNEKKQEIVSYAQEMYNSNFENIDEKGNILKGKKDNILKDDYKTLHDCISKNKLDIEKYIVNDIRFKRLVTMFDLIIFFSGYSEGYSTSNDIYTNINPVVLYNKDSHPPHSLRDVTLTHRMIPSDVCGEFYYFMIEIVRFCLRIEGTRDNKQDLNKDNKQYPCKKVFAHAHKYRNIFNEIIEKNKKSQTLVDAISNTIALLEYMDFQLIQEIALDMIKELDNNPHREILDRCFQYVICTTSKQTEDIFSMKRVLDDIAVPLKVIYNRLESCKIEKNITSVGKLFNQTHYGQLINLLKKHDSSENTTHLSTLMNLVSNYNKWIKDPDSNCFQDYLKTFIVEFLKEDPVKGLCQYIKNQMNNIMKDFFNSEANDIEKKQIISLLREMGLD